MTIIILLLCLIGIQGNDPIFIVKTKTYLSLLIHQKKKQRCIVSPPRHVHKVSFIYQYSKPKKIEETDNSTTIHTSREPGCLALKLTKLP